MYELYLEIKILQETCLASKEAMPFDLLKKKLMSRLKTMGIRIVKTYEEVLFVNDIIAFKACYNLLFVRYLLTSDICFRTILRWASMSCVCLFFPLHSSY